MIAIINGPNLNILGIRQPEIYGSQTFEDFLLTLRNRFPSLDIQYFQSNCEGELIDKIQQWGLFDKECEGIVINPGAFAHYSYAIADAIASVRVPVMEVHISNIAARDDFRHKSVTAPYCKGMIAGCGLEGYALAVSHLVNLI